MAASGRAIVSILQKKNGITQDTLRLDLDVVSDFGYGESFYDVEIDFSKAASALASDIKDFVLPKIKEAGYPTMTKAKIGVDISIV